MSDLTGFDVDEVEVDEARTQDVALYFIKPRSAADDETMHKVMCLNDLPVHTFDVFGIMAPATEAGECSVVQRILEHMDNCTPGHKIEETRVTKNIKDPMAPVYKLVVKWLT